MLKIVSRICYKIFKNKTVGYDGIPAEIIKEMGTENWKNTWNMWKILGNCGVRIPCFKKKKITKDENYVTISLIPHTSKIMPPNFD